MTVRANMNVTVRDIPENKKGKSKRYDTDYDFWSVGLLDSDFNKLDATLGDDVSPAGFPAPGSVLEIVCDITGWSNGERIQLLSYVDTSTGVKNGEKSGSGAR